MIHAVRKKMEKIFCKKKKITEKSTKQNILLFLMKVNVSMHSLWNIFSENSKSVFLKVLDVSGFVVYKLITHYLFWLSWPSTVLFHTGITCALFIFYLLRTAVINLKNGILNAAGILLHK